MNYYRCIETVIVNGVEAFTEGKTYQGILSATREGERAIRFINNQGQEHLMTPIWLYAYFTKIDEWAKI